MSAAYVFGAGASIHANYPLASKMGGELLDFMLEYKFEDNRFQSSAENLIEMFGKNPNVEDLISEIEMRLKKLEKAETDDDRIMRIILRDALTHIGQMLREWFYILHDSPAKLYARYADRIVKAGDTIITFNYDDSLERELKRAGKWDLSHGYGFPLGNTEIKSEVLLLKLHGSVNWLLSIFGGITSGGPFQVSPSMGALGGSPVTSERDAKYLGYSEFSGRVLTGGGVLMKSMILPGRCKQFFVETSLGRELEPFWNWLWNQAGHALSKAGEVVICGYSMPKADVRARDLLLKDTNKEASITVLSGGDSKRIADEFRDAGYKTLKTFGRGYFEDLIDKKE
jgi:hypothetical protein